MLQPTGRGAARPPVGIAFDGDTGHRIDALLAIAMLNGIAGGIGPDWKTEFVLPSGEAREVQDRLEVQQVAAVADGSARFGVGEQAGGAVGDVERREQRELAARARSWSGDGRTHEKHSGQAPCGAHQGDHRSCP